MPAKPPLTIGFNVPFHEAIAAAQLRGVVLPDVYYGELQGIARQLAFSIAGIASLDQLQAVKDSLSDYMEKGGSFKSWKKQSAQLNLELPAHRLDNIWRTNLQGNYMRGKWEKFQRNADTRPYLLYDAINDNRVRPSHLAHDGTIRPVTDAFWRTHSPPLGYRCVMPWTRVRGDFEIGLKSWYSGKAVEIKTKSGRVLTVTANHPILSNNGWVAAQTLKNGSKVLCNDPVFHGLFSGIVDNDYPPISAEQAFKTLSRDAFGFIDIAAFEFHGDTHLRKSKVYVAGRNSILMYGFKSVFFHRVKHRIFKLADHWRPQGVANTSRAGDSSPIGYAVLTKDSFNVWPAALLFIHNLQSAFSKCMSGKNALFSFIVSAFGGYPSGRTLSNDFIPVGANGHPFQFFRIATPTSLGSGISQASCNNAATDVMLLGKLKLAFSGLIESGNQIFINARSRFFRVFRHDRVHFRSGSTFNSVVPEQSIKEAIADPGVFQEFHDRFSSQVFIDEVLSVRDFAFSGHVYDFQCKNGIIVAEDIITHNCRCSLISLTEEQAQARSRPNPDGEGTGLYKTPQLEGGIPAEPDKGWDYNPFEDRMQWAEKALERFDPKLRAVGEKYLNPPSWTMINGGSATLDEMKRLGEERLNDLLDTALPDHVASSVAGWTPTPGATLREAMAKNMALPDTVMQWLRETTLQRAGQVRAMGGVKPALYQKSGIGVQLMRRVASKLPDEWVSHANQYPVHVAVSKARGFFSTGHWIPAKNELRRFIQTSSGSTAEHEFMHHIQHADSNLDALFAEEHRRRTLNDPVESLYPNDPKHKKEVGKRDSYVDVYQGREYSGKPLEVITMAFQAMLGGDKQADGYLHGTLYYDQDMLKLILGTLFHYSP